MFFKKTIAVMLALAMLLVLCGCDASETAVAVDEPVEETMSEPVVAETVAAEEAAAGLDFDAAYAAYDPETVIFYADGVPVTWQELFYQVVYVSSVLAAQTGLTITDWDEACPLYVTEDGYYFTWGAIVLQNAVDMLVQYHLVEKGLTEAGVTLSEEAAAAVEAVRLSTIETSFGGDEAAFKEYLSSVYCTEDLWGWYNEVDALYNIDGFEYFSGEMGSSLSDEDTLAYAAGDENGGWTEYVQLKLIAMYDETETGTVLDEASGEVNAEPAEETVSAEDILVEILTAEDREAKFAELYDLYNEEAQLDYFPDGWCVYQGDTADAVYQAALSMEIGEVRLVSMEGMDVIVLKTAIDPDAGVMYDTTTDTMYTLRYFAAWQNYAEMINGEEGWIARGGENSRWAEGFEDFSLSSVF